MTKHLSFKRIAFSLEDFQKCLQKSHVKKYRVSFTKMINLVFSETTSVNKCGGNSLFEIGQCQTDIFSVTAPGNNAPPAICGTNSGEHSK